MFFVMDFVKLSNWSFQFDTYWLQKRETKESTIDFLNNKKFQKSNLKTNLRKDP